MFAPKPLTVFAPDDGGGAGAPPAPAAPANPGAAATARIDAAIAAGLQDDLGNDLGNDPAPAAPPAPEPAAPAADGTPPPAPPAPVEDDPLAGVDFENLTYKQGKALERELKGSRERYRPLEQAFGELSDEDRSATVEALGALGADAGNVIGLVAGMHPNDRNFLFETYATALSDPAAGAQRFLWLSQQLAAAAGQPLDPAAAVPDPTGPAAPGAPRPGFDAQGAPIEPGGDELDAPMTLRRYQEMQQQTAAEAQQRQAEQAVQAQMLSDVKALGYDPDSSDPGTRSLADRVIWTAAYDERAGGDIKKADALLKAEQQAIIDGYLAGKKADASRPVAPSNGSSPSGQRDPGQVDPKASAQERIRAALGAPKPSDY